MESLRWVLLTAGVAFILFVYLRAKTEKRQDYDQEEYESEDSALITDIENIHTQDWDEVDEIINDVRISTREDDRDVFQDEVYSDDEFDNDSNAYDELEDELEEKKKIEGEVITLALIAKTEKINGDQINSAARASGLVFGDMDIFHSLDDDDEIIFSLSDMYEPGYFNPEKINEHQTRGLLMFMQPALLENPSLDLDDMLVIAYKISGMLGLQLSNENRQPFTENDAESYRQRVALYER